MSSENEDEAKRLLERWVWTQLFGNDPVSYFVGEVRDLSDFDATGTATKRSSGNTKFSLMSNTTAFRKDRVIASTVSHQCCLLPSSDNRVNLLACDESPETAVILQIQLLGEIDDWQQELDICCVSQESKDIDIFRLLLQASWPESVRLFDSGDWPKIGSRAIWRKAENDASLGVSDCLNNLIHPFDSRFARIPLASIRTYWSQDTLRFAIPIIVGPKQVDAILENDGFKNSIRINHFQFWNKRVLVPDYPRVPIENGLKKSPPTILEVYHKDQDRTFCDASWTFAGDPIDLYKLEKTQNDCFELVFESTKILADDLRITYLRTESPFPPTKSLYLESEEQSVVAHMFAGPLESFQAAEALGMRLLLAWSMCGPAWLPMRRIATRTEIKRFVETILPLPIRRIRNRKLDIKVENQLIVRNAARTSPNRMSALPGVAVVIPVLEIDAANTFPYLNWLETQIEACVSADLTIRVELTRTT